MKKQLNPKVSFLASALSIVLCVAMLVGTTFAWFSDSVTSKDNLIQAGTLKVDLVHNGNSLKADPNYVVFNYANWEPGYTTFDHFSVMNHGSLNFKYEVVLEPNGTLTALAEVLDVYVAPKSALDGVNTADRAAVLAAVEDNKLGTLNEIVYNLDGVLLAGNTGTLATLPVDASVNDFVVVIHMRESAGNVYQGLELCDGGFSMSLYANQLAAESDSFGPDYDASAPAYDVATATALEQAAAAGGVVNLAGNITVTEAITVAKDTVINLGTYTINSGALEAPFVMANGATLTINGAANTFARTAPAPIELTGKALVDIPAGVSANVVINGGKFMDGGSVTSLVRPYGTGAIEITLNDVTYTSTRADAAANVLAGTTHAGDHLVFRVNGGTYSSYDGFGGATELYMKDVNLTVARVGAEIAVATGLIENCNITVTGSGDAAAPNAAVAASFNGSVTVLGGTVTTAQHAFAIYSGANSKVLAVGVNVTNTSNGAYQSKAVYGEGKLGNITVATALTTISSAQELVDFANAVNLNGKTFAGEAVMLTADINLGGIAWEPIGQTGATQFHGVFDGQGHTIRNMTVNNASVDANCASGLFGWIESANAVVRNVTVADASVAGHHNVGAIAGWANCTIENCTVVDSTITATHANDDADGDKVGGILGYSNDAKMLNNKVANCTINGNRDVGGIVGATTAATTTFSNNSVADTTITYITAKSYASAGAIVSGRTGYVPDATNTATNVEIAIRVSNDAQLAAALANASSGANIWMAAGTYASFDTPRNANVNLIGAVDENGDPATVVLASGSEQSYWAVFSGNVENIVFTVTDDYVAPDWYGALTLNDTNGGYPCNVTFTNCDFVGQGLHFAGVANFYNCDFDGQGAYSAFTYCCPSGDIVIDGCTFQGYTFASIHLAEGTAMTATVTNCEINADPTNGGYQCLIELGCPQTMVFTGNVINTTINMWGTNTCTFEGNTYGANTVIDTQTNGTATGTDGYADYLA